jgi:hypothetical protein
MALADLNCNTTTSARDHNTAVTTTTADIVHTLSITTTSDHITRCTSTTTLIDWYQPFLLFARCHRVSTARIISHQWIACRSD